MALISDGRSAAPPAADLARPLGERPLGERPLAIGVLGGLSLAVDGAPLALANRKARGILAYLALEGAAPCSRERLAGLFWSDVGEKQARNSLRQAIFELREALEPRGCGALLVGRDHLALAPGRVLLDIDDMLARIALGEVPETLLSRAAGAMPMLSAYEDLSPLFAEWLRCARQLTQDRLERALERGFADPATPRPGRRLLAEAALRLNPVHEEACRTIMRLAAEDGEIGARPSCAPAAAGRRRIWAPTTCCCGRGTGCSSWRRPPSRRPARCWPRPWRSTPTTRRSTRR